MRVCTTGDYKPYTFLRDDKQYEGIDIALRLGLNFPRGPFEMLDAHGRDTVRATLAALESSAPADLKGRYLPAPDPISGL